jgi:hypothetical protein
MDVASGTRSMMNASINGRRPVLFPRYFSMSAPADQ